MSVNLNVNAVSKLKNATVTRNITKRCRNGRIARSNVLNRFKDGKNAQAKTKNLCTNT